MEIFKILEHLCRSEHFQKSIFGGIFIPVVDCRLSTIVVQFYQKGTPFFPFHFICGELNLH